MSDYIDIVFDGPPSHESGRFVEVEDSTGKSIHCGEWVEKPPFWRLRMPDPRRIAELEAEVERMRDLLPSEPPLKPFPPNEIG